VPEFSTGKGDFKISLQLMWGRTEPKQRGPKPGLTVERIVEAAITLADEEGLEALSMRKVAERLGKGAMSLYRYVPGKAELLDLMLDAIHGEEPPPVTGGGSWREQIEALAHHTRALMRRHPWMLGVTLGQRPPLGPNILASYERWLTVLRATGLSAAEMVATAELLNHYIAGSTRTEVESTQVAETSGVSDTEWWEERTSFWEDYFDPERFPAISAVYDQGAYDAPVDAFEFGLQRVLDGIEALLSAR
jgi:AcrR family transcriptional regulator